MSHSAALARTGQDRVSLYEEITNKIITELEAGRLPWVQPWGSSGVSAPLAMPKNAATGRGYSGINVLILWGAVVQHGFPTQSWLTFRQALGLGGNVRKGERGTTVVYADRFVPDDERRRSRETGDVHHREQSGRHKRRLFRVRPCAHCRRRRAPGERSASFASESRAGRRRPKG